MSDSAETKSLLEEVRRGNRQAFDRLFARHREYLRQTVEFGLDPRLRARVDPSDVVQETYLEAFRRLPDYLKRQPMGFRLWLRKTAQQHLVLARRRHLRTARRAVPRELPLPEHSSLQLAGQVLAPDPTPSQQLQRRELASQVRQALARLSDADREILLMRAVEGLSNQETAYVLGIEPGTARKRHARALLRLHKILSTSGFEESE